MAWNLPRSSGPFPVACTDILNKTGLDSTLFRLYYPTKPFTPHESICPLWLEAPEYGEGLANFIKFNKLGGLIKWLFGSARVPVLKDGPLVMPENTSKLPVVVFSHGLGGSRCAYCYVAYEIASHGFLVASIEHRDGSSSATFSMEEEGTAEKYVKKWLQYKRVAIGTTEERETRNTQVYERAKECSKLMDCIEMLNAGTLTNILSNFDLSPFTEKFDLEKCAIMGHSFGGATTIVSLSKDPRFKVGVAMDVWMFPLDDSLYKTKIEKSILFINTDSFQWKSNIAGIRKLDCDVHGVDAERKLTTLLGTVHYTQCDFGFIIHRSWLAKMIGFRGPTDPKAANDINMRLLLCFIGKHLNLNCGGEVDTLVNENAKLVISGSNLELDEDRLKESKENLKSDL